MESDKSYLNSTCNLATGELVQATGLFLRRNQEKIHPLLRQGASVPIRKKRKTKRHVRDESERLKYFTESEESEATSTLASPWVRTGSAGKQSILVLYSYTRWYRTVIPLPGCRLKLSKGPSLIQTLRSVNGWGALNAQQEHSFWFNIHQKNIGFTHIQLLYKPNQSTHSCGQLEEFTT